MTIHESAARLRGIDASNLFYWRSDAPGRDSAEIAAWALPLLDPTPVDIPWLESVGFIGRGDKFRLSHKSAEEFGVHLCFGEPMRTDDPPLRCWIQSVEPEPFTRTVKNTYIATPKTRGAVRQLCLALGITLKGESK